MELCWSCSVPDLECGLSHSGSLNDDNEGGDDDDEGKVKVR